MKGRKGVGGTETPSCTGGREHSGKGGVMVVSSERERAASIGGKGKSDGIAFKSKRGSRQSAGFGGEKGPEQRKKKTGPGRDFEVPFFLQKKKGKGRGQGK